ncbi:hypothetical protein FIU93_22850 [Labrenzia sp. THAF35]|uniref:hypothetical protein n=1 Tax=Labrenzia sp. THAF35 TaxID=2587854 RepID=UPI00126874B5|nr:hypothetical protein [Labrenzia sp. THAF35]QFT69641.1 hypothetical protein FIU93_22850 [Labrenzia sp. THAF35]
MTRDEARKAAELMQAYADGAEVEWCFRGTLRPEWHEDEAPTFDWYSYEYRVKPVVPDSIDWSHVAPQYKWMARDKSGDSHVFRSKPFGQEHYWGTGDYAIRADSFTSYTRGTTDWEDSLVERPEGV